MVGATTSGTLLLNCAVKVAANRKTSAAARIVVIGSRTGCQRAKVPAMGSKCVLLMILAGSALAQTPDVSLRIETTSGRAQFQHRRDDRHEAHLRGASAIFKWSSRPGGTVPLLGLQKTFLVSPKQGTSDPLGFRAREGFFGSVLSGVAILGKSWSDYVDLNQWVRLRPRRSVPRERSGAHQ